jgi:hypothetical protein
MKKTLVLLINLFPLAGMAYSTFYTADISKAPEGIVIVPAAKIDNSHRLIANLNEQKTKGYVYSEKNNALAIMKDNRNPEINDIINDPTDTHMKSDIKKIKLGFNFKPLACINAIGYAVGGAYIADKGWTAISTFFNDKELGSCNFKVNNMALSHGAVMIPQEQVQYDVNNKITSIYVEGSPKSGFVYNVMWDEHDYNYSLQCANQKYDADITVKMIQLAKKIDTSGNGLR